MTAKEMFEKLGYNYSIKTSELTLKKIVIATKGNIKLTFMEDINEPLVYGTPNMLDVSLHKSINKQMKELGWI